jgi:hypothetical protein
MVNHWLNGAAFEKLSLFVTFRYRMLERMASCFRTLVRSARRRLVAQSGVGILGVDVGLPSGETQQCRRRQDPIERIGAPASGRSSASTSVTLVADAAARKLLGAEERDLLRGWRLQRSSVGKRANPGLTPGAPSPCQPLFGRERQDEDDQAMAGS